MFKVNNRNTRFRCEICSKLTIKTTERRLVNIASSGVSPLNELRSNISLSWEKETLQKVIFPKRKFQELLLVIN